MNFALRGVAKKMPNTDTSFSEILEENIAKFAEEMKI